MVWIINNKGSVFITILAVMLGILFGLFAYSQLDRAEAVLGGPGNVTTTTNKHNLSSGSAAGSVMASSETRICIFCHTPHHAITASDLLNAPLWNHTLSTASYTVNSSGGVSNRGTPPGFVNMLTSQPQPDGASKLCLSCHDGTVAIGDVASGVANITMASHSCLTNQKLNTSCSAYIGTDLTVKHAVSIPMNDNLIANSVNECNYNNVTTKLRYPWDNNDNVKLRPTKTQYDSQYGIDGGTATIRGGSLYMAGYKYGVQCSTCHDPHYWDSNTSNPGWKFLAVAPGSLCGVCHYGC